MTDRPRFGLLLDWLEDEYQANVLAGVEDAARKLGVDLVVVAGGVLQSPHRSGAHRNFVFDLIGEHNVSGLIILAGTMGNYVGTDELARYCERYRPLPMCSVGIALPGMPCVLVDNQRGMRNLIVHLLQVHGYRRLAFIRGPSVNTEAERRYRVYREVLGEYGIPLEPQLVVEGDFQFSAGRTAIRTLLEERRVQFDAVIAADDTMALGAMDALQASGVRVPYDVAVVGFDDIEAARFASSPLTTVRQPLHENGAYAMQLVLSESRHEAIEDRVVLRTQLAVRQSCGCPPQTTLPLAQYARAVSSESLLATLAGQRRRIIQDMGQALRSLSGSLDAGFGERLLDALAAELRSDPEGVFLSTFDEVLTTVAALGGNLGAWQGAISILRHHVRACADSDPEACVRAEELWHHARVAVGNAAERMQAQQRLQEHDWSRVLRGTGAALSTTLDAAALSNVLSEELPRLKIPSCYVALFEDDRPDGRARMVAAHDPQGVTMSSPAGEPFYARELAPAGVFTKQRRTTHIVQPLYFESDQLGFAVFEMAAAQAAMSEHLRDQLNTALKSTLLFQQVMDEASQRQLAEKERTDQEVGIAGAIQRSLRPRHFDVPGLRVSVAMAPAGEVSGDYHDVIPAPDGCWLAIGDVQGSGLPAALALVSLQSIVSAVTSYRPTAQPREALCAVNAAYFEAIRCRLESDQPVALTLMRCEHDGRVAYAGAHEEIVVCRATDGKCTRLRTPGTRVGAVIDIDRITVDTHTQLEEGDLLVLYTDGAVNATNENGERFGEERLCTAIERLQHDPVERIRDQLLELLVAHMQLQQDDITLLVARYGVTEATIALDEQTNPV
jgi:sigma-B regulation protein RsbU (phosphoserine phosphatase)